MVKNTHGGSGHKKFGRKYTVSKPSNRLRISENEYEIYAIATKMLGNNMIHCHCIDGVQRLGHIRGKFTGRGKRDNMIGSGTWLLIGVRTWDDPSVKESDSKKKLKLQQCDILEVYSDSDKQNLKDTVDEEWIELDNNDISRAVVSDGLTSEF
jgi:translation initiation factor 1A